MTKDFEARAMDGSAETIEVEIGEFKTIVDLDVYEKYKSRWTWSIVKQSANATHPYVEMRQWGRLRGGERGRLHRMVVGAKTGEVVDHINGNTLDNRKNNLRIVNMKVNSWNSGKRRDGVTSKYKGVSWSKDRKYWTAQSRQQDGKYFIGSFDSETLAAIAYDLVVFRERGDYARTNFPIELVKLISELKEKARWGREAGLDEAAGIAVDKGKSVNGGYNNAAWEIAEAILAAKGKKGTSE